MESIIYSQNNTKQYVFPDCMPFCGGFLQCRYTKTIAFNTQSWSWPGWLGGTPRKPPFRRSTGRTWQPPPPETLPKRRRHRAPCGPSARRPGNHGGFPWGRRGGETGKRGDFKCKNAEFTCLIMIRYGFHGDTVDGCEILHQLVTIGNYKTL